LIVIRDLIAAIRAGAREFRRRRWLSQQTRNLNLPF
jgi:hypothetical protein